MTTTNKVAAIVTDNDAAIAVSIAEHQANIGSKSKYSSAWIS